MRDQIFKPGKEIDSDIDSQTFERIIVGRITRNRYKIIAAAVRRLDVGHIPTGSPYDCTGAHCGTYVEATFSRNSVTISTTYAFDC